MVNLSLLNLLEMDSLCSTKPQASIVAMEARKPELDRPFTTTLVKEKTAFHNLEDDEISSGRPSPASCVQDKDENGYVKEEDNSDEETASEEKGKPTLSYIALISMAILSTPGQRMLLSEIYTWIAKNFPYYKHKDRSWRNSVRHNLSLNECFVKVGRSENGKGNYWSIHPANAIDFGQGDFRRRRARRRVRQCNEELERLRSGLLGMPDSTSSNKASNDLTSCGDYYVPMTSTWAPTSVLAAVFGQEVILSPEEMNCMKRKKNYCYSTGNYISQDLSCNISRIQDGNSSCAFQQSNCLVESSAVLSNEEAQFVGDLPTTAQFQQTGNGMLHGYSSMGTSPMYGMHTATQYGTMFSNNLYE